MVSSKQVTLPATATAVVTAVRDSSVIVHSNSGAIYLGDSTVSASTGYATVSTIAVDIKLGRGDTLYAFAPGETLHVLVTD
jgi:hypothetical protein